MTEEINVTRQRLYNTMLQIPHRKIQPIVEELAKVLSDDPHFGSRALVYITQTSKVRDLQEAAIAALLQADPTYPEFREAGRCLLLGEDVYADIKPDGILGIEPFRILRVLEYIEKSTRKVPRLYRSIVTDWLRSLEADEQRFFGVVIHNRRNLKSLYKKLHFVPSPLAQAVLFDNNPPEGSKLAVIKQIANEKDVREQARLIIENRIPYRVASSLVKKDNPVIAMAMIEVMSPADALNSRRWVEESGLLNIPEVMAAYTKKVERSTKSAATIDHRKSAQGANEVVQAAVDKARETAVKKDKIIRPTLLLVDISSSMESAITTAVRFGERIAPSVEGELMVVCFNDYAQEIKVQENTAASWANAFRAVRCSGMTSIGKGLDFAIKKDFQAEQIVIITDGGENQEPHFVDVYENKKLSANVIVLGLKSTHGVKEFEAFCKHMTQAGIRNDMFDASGGDYYAYDQAVALLGGPKAKSIVEAILETELPHRA